MATAEELLNSISKNQVSVLSEDDGIFVIDGESRTITVPDSERLFGVEGDKDVERKYFQCPKIVGDNIDLSQHQIYVSYVFTTTENNTIFPTIGNGLYHCEDVEVSGDNITFSWLLSGNVFANPGFIAFKVMAKKSEGSELKTKWNTAPAFGTVLITVPDGEDIAEEYPDVINQIFDRLDALESGGGGGTGGTTNYENLSNKPQLNGVTLEGNKTLDQVGVLAKNQGASNSGKYLSVGSDGNVVPADAPSGGSVDPEQIKQAVNGYLEENPVSGMTAEEKEQLDKNTEDISSLSEEIANKTGTGLSKEAIDKLEEVGNYLAYTTADGGSKWTELISILRNAELSNSTDLWEVGGVQPTGTGTTSINRLRTVATLPYEVKKISVDDGYSYILVVYSEAQTEVPTDTTTVLLTGKGYYNPNGISGNVSADSFLVSSGTYFNGELLISEVRANINSIYGNTDGDRAHFRILLKNNDDATLTADDGLHIHLWG